MSPNVARTTMMHLAPGEIRLDRRVAAWLTESTDAERDLAREFLALAPIVKA